MKARVTEALLTGRGASEIARSVGVLESTVRDYRGGLTPEQFAKVCEKRGASLDELIFDYFNREPATAVRGVGDGE